MAKRPKLAPPPEVEFTFEESLKDLAEGLNAAKKVAEDMKLTFTISSLMELEELFGEIDPDAVDSFFADMAKARRVVSDLLGGGSDAPQALEDVLAVFFTALNGGEDDGKE